MTILKVIFEYIIGQSIIIKFTKNIYDKNVSSITNLIFNTIL